MTRIRRSSRSHGLLGCAVVAAVLLGATSVAQAAGAYSPGARGYDISYPQCGNAVPAGSFAIVGVTRGKSFRANPCFSTEYDQSATAANGHVSLYMNLNAPVGKTASQYTSTPVTCSRKDQVCQAHNYGWNAASFAYDTAGSRQSSTWWLDIETANSWVGRTDVNRGAIQGAIDYLQAAGVTNVGIYSTPSMWRSITGGWRNNLPIWYAGTSSTTCAFAQANSFTNGSVWLVQQASGVSNGDLSC